MTRLAVLLIAACTQDAAPVAPIAPREPTAITAPALATKAPPKPAQLAHVTIKALGMYCEESCPMRVRYAIAASSSIYELGFDTSKESIFVSYDATLGPAKDVTRPILAAITAAGFDPWLAKETWPDEAQALSQVVLR